MELRDKHHTCVLFLVIATFFGCSGEDANEARVDDVEVIPALAGPDETIEVQPVSARSTSREPRLQLREGVQKYYRRIVEQKLHEQTGIVFERVWERVELFMSLTVREASADTAWIEVTFHEVRYQHELGAHRIVYDSRSQAEIPPEALVYSGLKDNGFSFQVDASNRVVDVRDFEKFLNQCYRSSRRSDRQEALLNLGKSTADPRERIMAAMSFLDESIALLPAGKLAAGEPGSHIGTKWEQSSFRSRRVPTEEKLELGLIHVSGDVAHFKLAGTIHPLEPNGVLGQNGVRSRVIGGSLTG
ncbi:MAG TPA: hypothetical protein VMM56_17735, partial [Planctomycetaceae bacterium]|nr:hypothetical protein [Planctomycetaceae bacterium]